MPIWTSKSRRNWLPEGRKQRLRKNFGSKLKDATLMEFRSICKGWFRSNPNDRVAESIIPSSSNSSNDSNQERSMSNYLIRTPHSRRSPSPSASKNTSPGSRASLDRSFVDVLVNSHYVSPPRSPAKILGNTLKRHLNLVNCFSKNIIYNHWI